MNRPQSISAIAMIAAAAVVLSGGIQQTEREPLIAPINAELSALDVAVLVENVFLYPDERSLYGPGEENYGMPVKEEYGKGPVVVLDIRKPPDRLDKVMSQGEVEWIDVKVYSDGKPLNSVSTSSDGVFGFSFWVRSGDMQSIELEELGNVECKVRLGTVQKVCDLPLNDVPRGSQPFFDDEDVRIWSVKWEEKAVSYSEIPETGVGLDIELRGEVMRFGVVFKKSGSGQDIRPTSTSLGDERIRFRRHIAKSDITGAELWKLVPAIEKTYPANFVPQKEIFRD